MSTAQWAASTSSVDTLDKLSKCIRSDWVDTMTQGTSTHSAYRGMKRLLAKFPEVTAIFAMSDVMAIGAIRALQQGYLEAEIRNDEKGAKIGINR